MSCIYFHNEHADAEVRGWERAWMGHVCSGLLTVALSVSPYDDPQDVLRVLPADSYLRDLDLSERQRFHNTLEVWLRASGSEGHFVMEADKRVSLFETALNTALVMGSDSVRLLSRLHGQCEQHAFVEEPNRFWLSGIILHGLEDGVMRQESGWEDVVELLRSDHPGPVVTSFSVCDQFPNAGVAVRAGLWTPTDGAESFDEWYELPASEQWRLGMAALRQDSSLELTPQRLGGPYFGDMCTGFDVQRRIAYLRWLKGWGDGSGDEDQMRGLRRRSAADGTGGDGG